MKKDKDIKVNITLSYDDSDISKYVRNIFITDSVIFNYTNIIITLAMEFGEYAIKHNLRGKKILQLKISTKDPDENPLDLNTFDLLILESNISIYTQDIKFKESEKPTHTFQQIILHTIPYKALESLSTTINHIGTNVDKGPLGILKNILEKKEIKHKIDLRANNKNKIDQICIPPMSLNKTIKLLNENYGFYNGPLYYSFRNNGQLDMWCLEPKFKDKPKLMIYQYFRTSQVDSLFMKEIHEHEGTFKKEITYLTTKEPIHILRVANLNVIEHKFKHIYIKHPRNDLYSIGGIDVNRIINKTNIKGKIFKRNLHNRNLNNITGYHILNSGESLFDDTLEKANHNMDYIKSAPLQISLKGYYRIKHLLMTGFPVKLKSFVNEYKQFSGKYILFNTEIDISSKDDSNKWYLDTKLELVRYA